MSLGTTLRQAREEKGLTVSQVAESTRMMVQIVEDLEREDFRRVAAPIYGRGFIKLYAEHLGLNSEPLIREFMDIYTGTRPPQVVRRAEASADPAPLNGEPRTKNQEPFSPLNPETVNPDPATKNEERRTRNDSPLTSSSHEPDLFSVAAGRSEAVRSVADPAQPGEAAPPRVRPAASAQSEARPSESRDSTYRRPPAKLREAGSSDARQSVLVRVFDWLSVHGTPANFGIAIAGVVVLILIIALARGCKSGRSSQARHEPVKVERVLAPNKPYFN